MTFTIGRASFASGPSRLGGISHDGDLLSFGINIDADTTGGSLAVAKVLRQQVLGLANNADEPVVPVTWTDDPDFDGFYRVLGAQVEPSVVYLSNGFMRCQINLERISGGYASPAMETAYIANDHPGYTGTASTSLPIAGFGYEFGSTEAYDQYATTGSAISISTVGSADGNVTRPTAATGAAGVVVGHLSPANYYQGAARVEALVGGSWYQVVGQQIPDTATGLRISNGTVRLQFSHDGSSEALLGVYDSVAAGWVDRGVGWVTSAGALSSFEIGEIILGANLPWVIESNSRSSVVVSRRGGFRAALRSGSKAVALFPFADTFRGVGFTATTAVTSQTQGFTLASGNLFWMVGIPATSITADTANGRAYRAGSEIPVAYAGGVTGGTAATLYGEAFATVAGESQVVAR